MSQITPRLARGYCIEVWPCVMGWRYTLFLNGQVISTNGNIFTTYTLAHAAGREEKKRHFVAALRSTGKE